LRKNLEELETINSLLGGYKATLSALSIVLKKIPSSDSITIADIGSGGGDTLRKIAKWAKKKSIKIQLIGLDISDFMLNYAKEKSSDFSNIDYHHHDILKDQMPDRQVDIFTMNLFCHHFTDEELVEILRKSYTLANNGIIINDLHRHPLAYYSIKWITKILQGSYLVQNDAPLSVLRAFNKKELLELCNKAGIKNVTINWIWAFRWRLIALK
jgi:ubiquinone/menaquinone biosynthesis C-methylase UbiE